MEAVVPGFRLGADRAVLPQERQQSSADAAEHHVAHPLHAAVVRLH